MPILKYTTAVPVGQTVGEIQQRLSRRGVTRISTAFDGDGQPIGLGFEMATDYGIRSYEMPVRIAGVFEAVDVGDVRMVEGGEDLRFSAESREAVSIRREGIG